MDCGPQFAGLLSFAAFILAGGAAFAAVLFVVGTVIKHLARD